MRLQINPGCEQDISSLCAICDEMAGTLRAATNYPRPFKGLYPSEQDLLQYTHESALFVAKERLKVLGTVVLTLTPPDAYQNFKWRTDSTNALILRHFLIHPDFRSAAPAWELMRHAISYAKRNGMQSIRYHIYENDIPAICICEDCGFRYVGSLDLGFQAYGMHGFRVYELLL